VATSEPDRHGEKKRSTQDASDHGNEDPHETQNAVLGDRDWQADREQHEFKESVLDDL
jgi:hypothetical protein